MLCISMVVFMSMLIEVIKKICIENNIDFEEVKTKLLTENPKINSIHYTLEEVVKGESDYLLSLLKKELDKPKLRSGAQVRINALKTLCELIELNNKKLYKIEQALITISVQLSGLGTTK
jgi:hypothetical protein